ENLERHVVIGRARNPQHVALCLGIRSGPTGAVIIALLEGIRQVRNLAATFQDALSRRNRSDRAQPPEFRDSFCTMRLEIPIGGAHCLPNAVEVRMTSNTRGPCGGSSRSGRRRLLSALLSQAGSGGKQERSRPCDRADQSFSCHLNSPKRQKYMRTHSRGRN